MSTRFARGLVVGKFCPLHRGHMSVIDAALAACDQVFILSYSKPEFNGYPPAVRERWLKALYPQACTVVLEDSAQMPLPHNDAPDIVHRVFVGRVCEELFDVQVDAVFTSEDYGDGFAAQLSEYFWERGRARDCPVRHVMVDRARTRIPISGTVIRQHVHAARAYLDPLVYADFVRRVAVLGGESSGKTSLCQALAQRLHTAWVPEYGRDYWVEKGGRLAFEDMLQIGQVQRERERVAVVNADKWLLCDTTPLTTLFYSFDLFGRADPALQNLANCRYDVIFLCAPDFPFVQDGTRRDTGFRAEQHEWYQNQLEQRGLAYTSLSGSPASRFEQANAALIAFSLSHHTVLETAS